MKTRKVKIGIAAVIGVTAVIVMITFLPFLRNRISFGTWNPADLPDRVQCFGRVYYKSDGYLPLEEENLCLINASDNKTGKELYVESQGGTYSNKPVPTIIFLKTDEGGYKVYALSGGP